MTAQIALATTIFADRGHRYFAWAFAGTPLDSHNDIQWDVEALGSEPDDPATLTAVATLHALGKLELTGSITVLTDATMLPLIEAAPAPHSMHARVLDEFRANDQRVHYAAPATETDRLILTLVAAKLQKQINDKIKDHNQADASVTLPKADLIDLVQGFEAALADGEFSVDREVAQRWINAIRAVKKHLPPA